MPIYLPPISRRQFLGGSLAVGASAFFSGIPSAVGALRSDTQERSDTWALLSDTHIYGDREKDHRGTFPARNLAAIREDILAHPKRPGGAIVCGDCVHYQERSKDYKTLFEEVQPLREAGTSVTFVLGNHDHRQYFLEAVAEAENRERPEIPYKYPVVLESPNVNWFFLDALEKTHYTPGVLGDPQLKWLEEALDARADKPAILVAHHHMLFNVDHANRERGHLKDSDDLWAIIAPRKQVKAYVFGHTHQWGNTEREGVHLINIPATAWKFVPTAPTAWVLAELKKDGIALTPRCLDQEHPEHDKTLELTWRG